MHPREIAALLDRVGTVDGRIDRQLADAGSAERAITRWATALADVPATLPDGSWDVGRAIRGYYERRGGDNSAQYRPVEPHDILAAWAPHRAELMQRHTDPLPSADPDNEAAWRAELLGNRTAVATGHAAPSTHRELTSGIHPAIEARLASIGSYVPSAIRQQLAPYRPTAALREAAVTAGQPDPLSVPCNWCGAETGKPCRSRKVTPRGAATSNTPRRTAHPSRIDLARSAQEGVAA